MVKRVELRAALVEVLSEALTIRNDGSVPTDLVSLLQEARSWLDHAIDEKDDLDAVKASVMNACAYGLFALVWRSGMSRAAAEREACQ
jgi:hypothetical protein